MNFDDLPEALAWLDAHIDFESTMPTPARPAHPRPDARALPACWAIPQQAYPSVHITGTNGKGSTAAMATALLGAQGLTVGTYTSPNLSRVNERIARNGEPIDDDAFVEVLESLARLEPLMEDRPTRFELLTAAALAWFADEAVDVAVIEVGLGGRWDCTNVVDGDVAVLTNISFDHTEVLGPDPGGHRPGQVRHLQGGQPGGDRGDRPHAGGPAPARPPPTPGPTEVWVRGQDFACTANRMAVGGRLIDVRTPGAAYGELLVPLHGAHQGDNASCALAAVEAFFGAPLDEEVVEEAFAVGAGARPPRGDRPPPAGGGRRRPQRGRHDRAGPFAGRGVRRRRARRRRWSGMLTGRDPAAMLEAAASLPASGRWWPAPPTRPGPCRPRWWPRRPPAWAWR